MPAPEEDRGVQTVDVGSELPNPVTDYLCDYREEESQRWTQVASGRLAAIGRGCSGLWETEQQMLGVARLREEAHRLHAHIPRPQLWSPRFSVSDLPTGTDWLARLWICKWRLSPGRHSPLPERTFSCVSFSSCLFVMDTASLTINSLLSVVPGVREDECIGLGNLLCSCLGEAVIYGREGSHYGQPG